MSTNDITDYAMQGILTREEIMSKATITKKYHPEYDKASIYSEAAAEAENPEIKLLLERASATIEYLQKHRRGTVNLLVEINNEVVDALATDSWFDEESMEVFLPRIGAAIETADDSKHEFSTPYESWKHLTGN